MLEAQTPAAPGRRTRARRAVRRLVLARRRPLAAVCLALAVVTGVQAARPSPPPTVEVAVAARDLVSGTVLGADDLVVRHYPAAVAPVGSVPDAVGRTLAAPVRAGEPITDVRLVSPSLAAGYPGRVLMPVRIADADVVALLRVGDQVDVVAADPRRGEASAVAVDVPVVALPTGADGGAADDGGAALSGRLVVVAVFPEDVDHIAGASATDLLGLVVRG
jgi:Flp pilus assembly protein CpaB